MALAKNLAPRSSSEASSSEETGSRTGRQLKPTPTESMLRIYYVLSNCGLSFDEKPEIRVSVTRQLGGLDDEATIEIASLRSLLPNDSFLVNSGFIRSSDRSSKSSDRRIAKRYETISTTTTSLHRLHRAGLAHRICNLCYSPDDHPFPARFLVLTSRCSLRA